MQELGKLLRETWAFFRQNVGGICTVIMPIIIPLTICFHFIEHYVPEEEVAVFWLMFIAGQAVYPIYQGAMILYLASVLTEDYLTPGQYYRLAMKFWLRLVILYIFASVAVMAGLILLVIPGLIVIGRVAFSEFYCILQDNGSIDSLSASWKATESTQWLLIAGIIVIYLAISLPVYGLEHLLEYLELYNPVTAFLVSMIGAVLSPLVTIFAFRVYVLEMTKIDTGPE